jgi:hypothetical protein
LVFGHQESTGIASLKLVLSVKVFQPVCRAGAVLLIFRPSTNAFSTLRPCASVRVVYRQVVDPLARLQVLKALDRIAAVIRLCQSSSST